MKVKTIKAVLKKKMENWLESIEDEGVKNIIKNNTIVTGGCIASMLLKEEVNDFDVYFRTKDAAKQVAQYYVDRFKVKTKKGIDCGIFVEEFDDRITVKIRSAGVASEEGTDTPYQYFEGRPADEAGQYIGEIMADSGDIQDTYEETEELALNTEDEEGKPRYRPVFMSTNAITLSHKIQIIIRFFGEPDQIHENYDFVHCTNYWKSWDEELVLRPKALEALLARELVYVGSKYPVCSVIRLRKFIRRGWTINAGQILKMMMQISALDLTDIAVLREQLVGVDSAYFSQVLGMLNAKDKQTVDSAYLIEIIDRMF